MKVISQLRDQEENLVVPYVAIWLSDGTQFAKFPSTTVIIYSIFC